MLATCRLSGGFIRDNDGAETDSNKTNCIRLIAKGTDFGTIPSSVGSFESLSEIILSFTNNMSGLSGSIPPSIGSLRNLAKLIIQNVSLTGSIPPSVGSLKNAQMFKIVNATGITGSIPPAIGSLNSLSVWFLRDTPGITGTIPPSVGSLSRLEVWKPGPTRGINGTIPPSVGSLNKLTHFDFISNPGITGTIPPSVGSLGRLLYLEFKSNSRMTGTIPPSVGSLNSLSILDFATNPGISGTIPHSVAYANAMTKFCMRANDLGGTLPESFCAMWSYPFLRKRCLSAVVYLNLSANEITGPLQPAVFTDLTSLKKLDLSQNHLSGTIPSDPFVYALDHITELHLRNNKLTGVVPEAACGVTKCDMRGNPGLCRPFGLALLLHPTSCCGVQMFCSNTIIAIVVTIALFFILIIVANAVVVYMAKKRATAKGEVSLHTSSNISDNALTSSGTETSPLLALDETDSVTSITNRPTSITSRPTSISSVVRRNRPAAATNTAVDNERGPAHESGIDRTFATSNYKRFYDGAVSAPFQHDLLSAVNNVLELYAARMRPTLDGSVLVHGVRTFMAKIQDDAFKNNKALRGDVPAVAEYLWTSGKSFHLVGSLEFSSVLNAVIRDDVAEEIEAAVTIFRSLNSRRVKRTRDGASLQIQSYPPKGETWRGGGFRSRFRNFFEGMEGMKYRVPAFLATSIKRTVAINFAFKADRAHPCALWRITFDPRGKRQPEYRVQHMTFVSKTLMKGESEYLFAPYSVFTLVSVKWSGELHKPHEFTIRAARDNKREVEELPLTPWY